VARVDDTYIQGKPAVVQSVIPQDVAGSRAQPDNFEIPERLPRAPDANANLEERAVTSAFDRTQRPEPPANPLVAMPDFWRTTLDNGIEVIGTVSTEVPVVNLRLIFEGGHLLETPEQYGLASLTAAMMNEGTEQFTAEEFETELRKLGSNISVGAGNESMVITVQTLLDNLDPTLALLEQRLFESAFTEEDLARLKQQQIEAIEAEKEQPSTIANNVYRQLVYGEDHAFSVSPAGEVETLEGLTLADIENFARANLVSQALDVTVVGEIGQEEILAKLA